MMKVVVDAGVAAKWFLPEIHSDAALELRASSALLTPAFELAVKLDRSVYDSLYLAVAVAEECAMVTADAKFHSVLAASPLANHVRWVEDKM